MFKHRWLDVMPKRTEKKLTAFTPCKLHRRHEITIAGNKDDNLRLFFQGQRGDIHANAHINAFLLDLRRKVFASDFACTACFTPESFRPHMPAVEGKFAKAQSNERKLRKFIEQPTRRRHHGGCTKIHRLTG